MPLILKIIHDTLCQKIQQQLLLQGAATIEDIIETLDLDAGLVKSYVAKMRRHKIIITALLNNGEIYYSNNPALPDILKGLNEETSDAG